MIHGSTGEKQLTIRYCKKPPLQLCDCLLYVSINHCLQVYTVGPEYAHAEARKSPSLDGKVERDNQGKEIRYPVILNQYEKELANKVCKLFKVWHSDLFEKLSRKKNPSPTAMNCCIVCSFVCLCFAKPYGKVINQVMCRSYLQLLYVVNKSLD